MAISVEKIKELIRKKFPQADIEIIDTAGDSNHYSATIATEEFRGKSRVEQHKLVYKALEGAMDGSNGILHALALQTKIK
ncbi:BolA/IbaG family iron-sulfur metabolism protein [Paracoccaceae bacterium]|nr:BolA/IbaG family iron-sulfur metabolism protein [Paracoccaceae bacterium]